MGSTGRVSCLPAALLMASFVSVPTACKGPRKLASGYKRMRQWDYGVPWYHVAFSTRGVRQAPLFTLLLQTLSHTNFK